MAQGKRCLYKYLYFNILITKITEIITLFPINANILLTQSPLPIINYRGGEQSMSTKQYKHKILKKVKALNPHPERVKVPIFKTHPFFDPEDKVQVKDHLQSRWWFPSQKSFKGIDFELIFFEILYTTSKGGGFLLAVKKEQN